MHRCIELALMGKGKVAPNPMVGAVLVHEGRIIGEGCHRQYGGPHAEVNCLSSVNNADRHLIPESVLYVSLEPCAHFGKTPPCADLVLKEKIPKVVIGCRDPFVQVDGKGIDKLLTGGVEVITGVLQKECEELNRRFFHFHTRHRPFVLLKWAQTMDGKVAHEDYSRLRISNEYTNRLVHQWRSEEMAILVGTNTAAFDDPELTTRLWPGPDPVRLVVDMDLRLPSSLKLFNRRVSTIVFNTLKHETQDHLQYYQVTADVSLVHQVMNALYNMKIQSVMVEGGPFLLQSFIDEGCWDEARVISNEELSLHPGLPAPQLKGHQLLHSKRLFSDTIRTFIPDHSST